MLPGLPSWDFYQVSGWTLGRLPSFTEFFAVIRSDYLVLLGCQLNSKALTYFYRVLHWNLELLPSFTGFPAELYGAYLVLPSFPLISGAIKDTLGFSCSFSWIFSRLELAWTRLKKSWMSFLRVFPLEIFENGVGSFGGFHFIRVESSIDERNCFLLLSGAEVIDEAATWKGIQARTINERFIGPPRSSLNGQWMEPMDGGEWALIIRGQLERSVIQLGKTR